MSLYGFLGWLVPFVVACFLYTPQGGLRIDLYLFKTLMILIGNAFGTLLMVLYFKTIKEDIIKSGVILAVVWLAIFWILDMAILVPMSKMAIDRYFIEIGLRYLLVPVMSMGIAYSVKADREK